jgi:WD40 repeat protein
MPDGASRYQAFMSYSHAADGKLAPALQHALQTFAKPWNRLRAIRVFRDKTGLTANPGLFSAIIAALDDAAFFMLLASPASAQSHWVGKEVEHWLATRRSADRVLIVLTDGQIAWDEQAKDFDWRVTDALPRMLHGAYDEEPLWIDLRWALKSEDLSLQNPAFVDAVADLSSSLRGVSKDELIGEDVRQHRRSLRFRRGAVAGLSALALALALSTTWAIFQRDLARRNAAQARDEAQRALARQLAAQSAFVRGRRANLPLATLLAVEAARRLPGDAQADDALRSALALLPRQMSALTLGGAIDQAVFDARAQRLVVSRGKQVQSWDLEAGVRRAAVQARDNIGALTVSADGKRFAVATGCRIGVYEADSGRLVAEKLLDQRVQPYSVPGCIAWRVLDFSPDAALVVAGGNALVSRVWNIATGQVVDLPREGGSAVSVQHVGFSPDGTRVSVARNEDVAVWRTSDWAQLDLQSPPPASGGEAMAFSSPLGAHIASVSGYGVSVWNGAVSGEGAGRVARQMPLGGDNFTETVAVALSPRAEEGIGYIDEGAMVAAAAGSTATVWRLDDGRMNAGREVARLDHQGPIRSLQFFADAKRILTASDDGTAGVWAAAGGAELARLVHGPALMAAAIAADGSVWTVDKVGQARRWDMSTPSSGALSAGKPQAFVGGGAFVVAKEEFSTDLVETQARGQQVPRRFKGAYYAVSSGPDGQSVLVARYAGKGLEVRDLLHDKQVLFLANGDIDATVDSNSYTNGIDGVRFSPDGRYIVVEGHAYSRMWAVASRHAVPLGTSSAKWYGLCFSPDGRWLAGQSEDGGISVFEVSTGHVVSHLEGADVKDLNPHLAFSPDGSFLASMQKPAKVWRLQPPLAHGPLYTGGDDVGGEGFTGDSGAFVARERYGTVLAVDLSTKQVTKSDFDPSLFAFVATSPVRPLVAMGSGNTVLVRDTHTGRDAARLDLSRVTVVAFDADGSRLAVGDGDGLVRIWDSTQWQERSRVRYDGPIASLIFSADGRFLAVGVGKPSPSTEVNTHVMALGYGNPITEACRRLGRDMTQDEWTRYLPGQPYRRSCTDAH